MWKSGIMCLISILLRYDSVSAQSRQQACTIPSLCNDLTIEPRIVSPIQGMPFQVPQWSQPNTVTPCPMGYVLCTNIKCGVSSNPVLATDQNGYARRSAFPWHVFIQDATRANAANRGYAGGGVLISPSHVLTAAHKINNLTQGAINIRMGMYNINDEQGVQTRAVSNVFIYNGYYLNDNSALLKNNLAILRLQQPINVNNDAGLMCLPNVGRNYQGAGNDGNCWVAGFGQTAFSVIDAPHSLKQIKLPIVTNEVCRASYASISSNLLQYLDFPGQICAGGQAGIDACTQDGGSGLVCRDSATSQFSLVGLVNWGKNCGTAGVYGVYVNVPNYVNWINSILAT